MPRCRLGPARPGRRWSRKQDRERWNDWGIGLLLQGDLKGAEYAFKQSDRGRTRLCRWLAERGARADSGRRDRRRQAVYRRKRWRSIRSSAASGSSRPLIEKADGDYDGALAIARDACARKYPRDRVVLNQIARIQFLKRQYAEAVETLEASVRRGSRRCADALHR